MKNVRHPGYFVSKDWKLKQRKPIRHKKIKDLVARLTSHFDLDVDFSNTFLETAKFGQWNLLLVDKSPVAMEVTRPEGIPEDAGPAGEVVAFPTLRGMLKWDPARKWCEVDHGAIPFLMNGADCMAAGIHAACDSIQAGDLIWIRDQQHGKPLAIGWALLNSTEMTASMKGRAVKALHYIGDELWGLKL